jgi:hypothetical protein
MLDFSKSPTHGAGMQLETFDQVRLERLCRFRIWFASHHQHETPLGTRLTFAIGGGRCDGPRLSGEFLAVGGDWVLIGTDGIARLDVRATLRTDDGATVDLTSTGRAHLDGDAVRRFYAGELVGMGEMYARSSPLFVTGDERYAWLNGLHTVAVNRFSLAEVHYDVTAVR